MSGYLFTETQGLRVRVEVEREPDAQDTEPQISSHAQPCPGLWRTEISPAHHPWPWLVLRRARVANRSWFGPARPVLADITGSKRMPVSMSSGSIEIFVTIRSENAADRQRSH